MRPLESDSGYNLDPDDQPPPPRRPKLPPIGKAGSPLGSLAQSAREKSLTTARSALFGVGLFLIIIHAIELAIMERAIDMVIEKQLGPGQVVDPEFRTAAINAGRLIDIGLISIGVLYFVAGAFVKRFPVLMTTLGLIVFVSFLALTGYFYPPSILGLWWLKLILIIALAQGMKAAFAYEKHRRESRASEGWA